ncbi:MAG: hypothetical protein A2096_09165 [Spirochaetes bacterium GWF1_41_5]|nr:MAG: hypothetical protein A2096_09165 [Spirochaetes bacterium GWF1_41_5]HBE03247.1 hypothetical protein [Spirochaetia bacterium]
MNKEQLYFSLREKFLCILSKYNSIENKPYKFGINNLLYPSEIHTMCILHENEKKNITCIAGKLGVSRSALSQLVNKLAAKGLVKKYKKPANEKEIFVSLTEKAQIAYGEHEKFHREMSREIINELEKLSRHDINIVMRVFDILDSAMNKLKAVFK